VRDGQAHFPGDILKLGHRNLRISHLGDGSGGKQQNQEG